jgi:hypothetical protein
VYATPGTQAVPLTAAKPPVFGTLCLVSGVTAVVLSLLGALIYLIVWWTLDLPNKISIIGGLEAPGSDKLVLPKVLNYLGVTAAAAAGVLGTLAIVFDGLKRATLIGLSLAAGAVVFLFAFWVWTVSRSSESYVPADTRLSPSAVDLGPLETQVNGELHIYLTGWQPKGMDYSVLRARPEVVVLQMANEDVTDRTLENLRGLKKLRELDLSDTQVTDAGLKVLQELPSLQVLFLNRTKITDEGVRQSIFPIASLTRLSVSHTQVTKKTRDEWKADRGGPQGRAGLLTPRDGVRNGKRRQARCPSWEDQPFL